MRKKPWWRLTESYQLARLLAIGGLLPVAVLATAFVFELADLQIWSALGRLGFLVVIGYLTVAYWVNWHKLR